MGQICPLLPPPSTLETGEAAQGVGGARPAALGLGDGRGEGETREGGAGDRFPAAARPGAVQGDLAAVAGGKGRRWSSAGVPEAWWRAIGRGKASRGSGDPFSLLTSVRGSSGRTLPGGGRSLAAMGMVAALETRIGGPGWRLRLLVVDGAPGDAPRGLL